MTEFNNFSLKNRIAKLLSQQKLGVLATQGEKYPYNNLVAYIFTEDLKFILFATGKETKKYQNILKNPYISMLIDSRTNNNKDFEEAVALTITAKSKETEKQKYRNIYLDRFPELKEFLENPQTALMLLEVHKYLFVYHFQEVLELKMK